MKKTRIIILCGICCMAACSKMYRPSDPDATTETKTLYGRLFDIARQGIMFGHQDATLYGVGWYGDVERSDVKCVCGDYPAVYGWELGGLELGCTYSIDSVSFEQLRAHILAAYARNGINTVSWHLHNPETGEDSWAEASDTAVASILPGGARHAEFLLWLDRVGAFFNSLKDEQGKTVPILFRPFHEHTGSWFWWGKEHCSPKQYVEMWRFTVAYLREHCQVHNLLYAYSPDVVADMNEYLERYPGDEWVDLLGLDAYDRDSRAYAENIPRLLSEIKRLAVEKHKLFALTETGREGVPEPMWWTSVLQPAIENSGISYVLVWRNAYDIPGHFFGPWPGHSSAGDFKTFVCSPYIFLGEDLPDMYN